MPVLAAVLLGAVAAAAAVSLELPPLAMGLLIGAGLLAGVGLVPPRRPKAPTAATAAKGSTRRRAAAPRSVAVAPTSEAADPPAQQARGERDGDGDQLRAELTRLLMAQDLQHSLFEISAELVGCVSEEDARDRFAAAIRTWWACTGVDIFVWNKGTWRSLGGTALGEAPAIAGPVTLPEENDGDLVLDLSPAVDGQAALVVRYAMAQPSLYERDLDEQRYVADVLRGQFALSLRRVILFQDLQRLGRSDPLTRAFRRWYGEERLGELTDLGAVVAVAMIDIDDFKSINDEHGHAVGDQTLQEVGITLRKCLRAGDLISRFGGEEFLAVLPDTSPGRAVRVAERLRESVAAIGKLPRQVTISIGVAACRLDESSEELIGRADEALYAAKNGGKNRVVLADGDDAEDQPLVRTTQRRKRGESDAKRSGIYNFQAE